MSLTVFQFITGKGCKMKRKNKTWKPEYDEYLIRNFSKKTYAEMVDETGYHTRTIYNHAHGLGLTGHRQPKGLSKKEKQERKGQLWELLSGESSLC